MARAASKSTSKKGKAKSKAKRGAAPGPGRIRVALGRIGQLVGGLVAGADDEETHGHLREIGALLLIGFAVWLGIALFSFHQPYSDASGAAYSGVNWGGQLGFYLASWVLVALGLAGYLCVALGIAWGAVLVSGREVWWPLLRVFGTLCFLFSTALLLQLSLGEGFHERMLAGGSSNLPYGPGGWLARELIGPSENHSADAPAVLIAKFGRPGLWILLLGISLSSFLLATERTFYPSIRALLDWLGERRESQGEGAGAAVKGFAGRTLRGWWDFLRGADLELEPQAPPAAAAKAKAKATKTTPKKTSKKKAEEEAQPELFEEYEDDEEGEWEEEGAEEEWDEEPAASDDEEWEEGDEDEEWEEEDGDEAWDEDEEWEYEDEEEADADEVEPIVPAAALPKKKPTFNAPISLPFDPPTPPPGPWKFPPLDLLEPPSVNSGVTEEARGKIEAQAEKLENALRSFRVEANVVGSTIGPSVTMFELEVAQGTRMNRVTTLSSEIAAALKARSVRIIAPIPGRSTIGIEVPNGARRLVRFSELICKEAYDPKFAALPLFLGMDAEGNPIVEDLARMPHLLIAGQTGAGKSVCINTIIASLLLTRTPHEVQMIMVDPKMVELAMYSNVPHQMCPVVTDMKHATNVLLWAVEKMEGRYDLFKNAGVRNIKGYNALGEDKLKERMGDDFNEERTPRHVPYIVIIIDEMADLMMISKKEAEQAITRLAQKSRAVGIHVIVATQRPSTDVITGVLKANLPTRIAFTVASKIDSRVILDAMGAEKLLGQGDMLYNPPQSSSLKRVQGALVEDHELQAIVDFVEQESAPTFSQELIQAASGSRSETLADKDPSEQDDLWDDAVRVILKSKRGSASLLQRALGIGYTRASRLIDMMRDNGVVGAHKGSKASEVLLTLEQWEEMYGAAAGSGVDDD
ncbi:DNA translocase FtsK [Engelhardtia mirabilis]|uniref:DNA translocase FtsK n=1 Tax=Engelhardtia mirabilis TaxID=2528011 RepID=A0A518BRT7_9BACT|nr:DNA translocase FtsK [Planctomycetes bacterium Pla133]QDV04013.1 DNA translocase FtsK [Planctomycetes bacterium Pla86]